MFLPNRHSRRTQYATPTLKCARRHDLGDSIVLLCSYEGLEGTEEAYGQEPQVIITTVSSSTEQ